MESWWTPLRKERGILTAVVLSITLGAAGFGASLAGCGYGNGYGKAVSLRVPDPSIPCPPPAACQPPVPEVCKDSLTVIMKDHFYQNTVNCQPGQVSEVTQDAKDWTFVCRCPVVPKP